MNNTFEKNDFFQQLCSKAELKWGLKNQILMLSEESNELSLAALKVARHLKMNNPRIIDTSYILALAEEIADVEIMISEFKFYFPMLVEMSQCFKFAKILRLSQRLGVVKK